MKVRGLLLKGDDEQGPISSDGSMEPHTCETSQRVEDMVTEDRPRGRSRWPIAVAGLVVLGLVSGAAGMAIGRATAPGPTIVVAPGPVVQQSPAASSLPVAPGETRPGLVVATTSRPSVPAVFTAGSDLPDVPGVATGYALSAGEVEGSALATALATALGISGDVAQTADGWLVGSTDGTVPTVTVTDDPLLNWAFRDPKAQNVSGGVAIDPNTAREQAAALLGSIGVDVSSVDWQVDRFADRTTVTAWQLLNGARTDLAWDVSVGKGGAVASAHGFAADFVEVPGYVVVGAATAVRRSAAPTWAALGPQPVVSTPSALTAPSGSASSLAPTLNATGIAQRPALTVPIARIEVVAADLGLAQYRQPDGGVLILPSYRITGADDSQWSVLALTTADVDFVAVPYPSASPATP